MGFCLFSRKRNKEHYIYNRTQDKIKPTHTWAVIFARWQGTASLRTRYYYHQVAIKCLSNMITICMFDVIILAVSPIIDVIYISYVILWGQWFLRAEILIIERTEFTKLEPFCSHMKTDGTKTIYAIYTLFLNHLSLAILKIPILCILRRNVLSFENSLTIDGTPMPKHRASSLFLA